ncbi:MAG: 1,4-dihydroxy-2-naphthoate polyprenyltransferase [Candidatus Nanopelagicales bacterium]|jgi:1,4-dihydroxy-2-naphthoate octaprenyltransferase
MATASEWVAGARPRTLGAAIAPVAVGTGVAASVDALEPWRAALALIVMVAAQIGANYANDYSDGIRGTDSARVGPVRLVGQGLAAPGRVKRAALISLGVSAAAGLLLVTLTGRWWLLGLGAAALLAAWLYTGGPRPYGYLGLGEIFVFIFFGLVPVIGTTYVQALSVPIAAWVAAIGVGSLTCAILVANNLRDIPTDAATGKITLAVRLGDRMTRIVYVALVVAGFAVIPPLALPVGLGLTFAWFGLIAAFIAIRPVVTVCRGASGRALVPVLQATGALVLGYGVLVGLGIALS